MASKRTTLASIAQALEISVSTVSKALSDSPEIGAATKKRVLAYAKANNYTPNSFASSFRRGTTSTIGLIIPNIINPFYAKVLVGVENYLDANGYKLITSISNDLIEKETKNLSIMSSGFVDGVIICISKEAQEKNEYQHIKTLIENGVSIVMFDRICEEIACDKVITDDFQAAFDATEFLIQNRNCKHIVITAKSNNLHHLKLRLKGFEKAIEKHGSTVKCTVITEERSKVLKQKLGDLLKKDASIDGVFGLNEKSVLHAILLTNKLQKEDPTIAIAGFCNDMQSKYDSSLIVINQNAKEIGMESAKLLLERIKSTEKNKAFLTKTIAVNL